MPQIEWIESLGQIYKNQNLISVVSRFIIEASLPTQILTPLFLIEIANLLRINQAVTGCNVSMKNDMIGAA